MQMFNSFFGVFQAMAPEEPTSESRKVAKRSPDDVLTEEKPGGSMVADDVGTHSTMQKDNDLNERSDSDSDSDSENSQSEEISEGDSDDSDSLNSDVEIVAGQHHGMDAGNAVDDKDLVVKIQVFQQRSVDDSRLVPLEPGEDRSLIVPVEEEYLPEKDRANLEESEDRANLEGSEDRANLEDSEEGEKKRNPSEEIQPEVSQSLPLESSSFDSVLDSHAFDEKIPNPVVTPKIDTSAVRDLSKVPQHQIPAEDSHNYVDLTVEDKNLSSICSERITDGPVSPGVQKDNRSPMILRESRAEQYRKGKIRKRLSPEQSRQTKKYKGSSVSSTSEGMKCEVQSILAKTAEGFYLVKWKDWPLNACTWEVKADLDSCTELLLDFEKSVSSGKSPSIPDEAPPPPVVSQIERILTKNSRKRLYCVKWEGYDVQESTWHTEEDLRDVGMADMILEFQKNNEEVDLQGIPPPRRTDLIRVHSEN